MKIKQGIQLDVKVTKYLYSRDVAILGVFYFSVLCTSTQLLKSLVRKTQSEA